jgi:hypothetical protein
MPAFETPTPIAATLELRLGAVRVDAHERATTNVDVRPSDPGNAEDVKVAEQTRVEYLDGRLRVIAPRSRAWIGRRGGSIDVTVELPAGSRLDHQAAMADLDVSGRLDECRVRTGIGRVRLDEVGTLHVRSGAGDIAAERVAGRAEITTGAGAVELGTLEGTGVIKNSNGDTSIREARGDLRVQAANGDVAVGAAHAGVTAKSANGDVRVGEVVRGAIALETRVGDVELGIRAGTAAWLDVSASAGRVHNALEASDAPGEGADSVEVRARTSLGEIVVRRA